MSDTQSTNGDRRNRRENEDRGNRRENNNGYEAETRDDTGNETDSLEDRIFSFMDHKFTEQMSVIQRQRGLQKSKQKFKYSGNEHQFEFNSDIQDDLEESHRLIQNNSKVRAGRLLEGAINKIKKRNKCLKIADRSEGGWDTVKEYLTDDLAEDSADEKKLRSADARAMAKKKKEQARKPYYRTQTSTISRPVSKEESSVFYGPKANEPPERSHSRDKYRYYRRGYGETRGYQREAGNWQGEQRCWGCGARGHYRNQCRRAPEEDGRRS